MTAGPVWFRPEITLGSVCNLIGALCMAVGIVWGFARQHATDASDARQTQRDLQRLETALNTGFAEVKAQTGSLPGLLARLDIVEQRLAIVTTVLEDTRRLGIQTQAEVSAFRQNRQPNTQP